MSVDCKKTIPTITTSTMDQSDIQYILDILTDAINDKDWEKVEEAKETMKEFLDDDSGFEDD